MTTFIGHDQPTWQGSFNLADVGGLDLRDGGVTRTGRVFRSGVPDYITTGGWRAARATGVRTVIDLRNPGESARESEKPTVDADAKAGIRFVSCPTEDPDDPQFIEICGPWLDDPLSYAHNIGLYPEKFAGVFREIADAEGAVLVHCAAGRDRTGMVMAMLLSVARVTPEVMEERIAIRRPALLAWLESLDVEAYLRESGLTAGAIDSLRRLLR